MWIIIRYYSNTARPTYRLDISSNSNVLDLQEKLFSLLKISPSAQLLKFKRDGYTLRIIPGWDLDFYEIKEGSIIYVEKRLEI